MMNLISLLAVDDIWGEVIAVSIGVIIMVGSALGKALKKKDESNAAGRAAKPAQRADLDDLAAKRRAELMAEAQRRRLHRRQQGRPTPPVQQQTQTTQRPLTMADRLRQARQQAMEQASAHAQQRRQQLEAHRLMQQRPRHQPTAPHRPQQTPQQQRPPARPAAVRPPQRHPQPRPQPEPSHAEPAAAHYEKEHEQVHRLVRDNKARPLEVQRAMLDHHSLRQAIIWKEILDKPLALRDLEP